ncbi:MAG: NupC/NupG family nucleoside CNT transporter [Candidatus Marinimicrobia bacterium]|nr:NupC/NupG family nucleoside CNT transporter [Candidatus Neomarinimicrobiota bacterium]
MIYYLAQFGLINWLLAVSLIAIFGLRLMHKTEYQKYLISTFLISGWVYNLTNNIDGKAVFSALSAKVETFLKLTDLGSGFLFGNIVDPKYSDTFGFQFAFGVLPTIIFFAAFLSILYHIGVMQAIVNTMAKFMKWTMGTSGAETLSVSANIFIGQTESPLLIKPFLNGMTQSELATVMIGGFATIAGGVLAGYIRMGIDPGHLLAASVMSAPAALVIAKIIFPETEHSETAGDVEIPRTKTTINLLDAATAGVTDGLKLAVNVGAMLIAFIALIGLLDLIFNFLDGIIDGNLLGGTYQAYSGSSGFSPVSGEYSGIFPGSLKTFFGFIFRPLAWSMGVAWHEADKIGNLLGVKIALNEFVAYAQLGNHISAGDISVRSITIATYALCGFANFSSIGIQIGGIAAIAPSRRSDLAKVGLKAMFGGALASWMTATIAGILL